MLSYESSTSINAPVESIWQVLSDVIHWDQWTPTVTRVEALDRSELRLGDRYRVHQPKLRPTVWTVTAIEPLSSFTWEARSPGMVMVAEHTLRRSPAGHTDLTLRFSFQGMLGVIVGKMNRNLVENYLATEAALLRKCVEGLSSANQGAKA